MELLPVELSDLTTSTEHLLVALSDKTFFHNLVISTKTIFSVRRTFVYFKGITGDCLVADCQLLRNVIEEKVRCTITGTYNKYIPFPNYTRDDEQRNLDRKLLKNYLDQ